MQVGDVGGVLVEVADVGDEAEAGDAEAAVPGRHRLVPHRHPCHRLPHSLHLGSGR